jgi:histidine phosphotransfer protein HptB
MSTIDPNLLDAETVTTFVEMGREVISSLVELYVENATQEIQKLVQSAQANSMEEVKKTAHSLKGASLNTGARAMGQLCLEIEKNAKENNLGATREEISRLTDLLENTRLAFLQTYP